MTNWGMMDEEMAVTYGVGVTHPSRTHSTTISPTGTKPSVCARRVCVRMRSSTVKKQPHLQSILGRKGANKGHGASVGPQPVDVYLVRPASEAKPLTVVLFFSTLERENSSWGSAWRGIKSCGCVNSLCRQSSPVQEDKAEDEARREECRREGVFVHLLCVTS